MVYGARPLKRVIQRNILNPLAQKILAGEIRDGTKVVVDRKGGKLLFQTVYEGVAAE